METLISEFVVIGAGVVGLSVAREIASTKRDVIVIEKEQRNGSETSSRNSGVIHSGIYYPKGSLKSRLCVEGNRLLYEYAKSRKIGFFNAGKIVLANSRDDVSRLEKLKENGSSNEVEGLNLITSAKTLNSLVEGIRATAGLFCSSSGIIDTHDLVLSLETDLQSLGVIISNNTSVTKIGSGSGKGYELEIHSHDEPFKLKCDCVINCGGLNATEIARNIEAMPRSKIPSMHYAKGHYFYLSGNHPFKDLLVYPLPSKDSLGIHMSPDISGRIRFGPDLRWIDKIDYKFEKDLEKEFYRSIKTYWPSIKVENLHPDYTGIRPKIYGPDEIPADFHIQTSDQHGLPGLVNLFGIESPGLTSCLAIGKYVADLF